MEWYYATTSKGQTGPVSEEKFQVLVTNGTIKPKTLVWNATMADWQKYGDLTGNNLSAAPKASGSTEAMGTSICAECGAAYAQENMIRYGDAWVCANCKPVFVQKLKEGVNTAGAMEYAGFWIRFGAKFIDGIILNVVNMAISFTLGFMMAIAEDQSQAFVFAIITNILSIAIGATYTTWMLGKYGATLGKMACRIQVVTPEGGQITYLRAFGRHFAEILSAIILLIGYIMAAFDVEKRSLHDRICNTRVVKK